MEKRKSVLDGFDGYVRPKEKPKPEWNVCEEPPGYRRRIAFYKHLEKVEKEKAKNGKIQP